MRKTLISIAALGCAAAAVAQSPLMERSPSRISPKGDPNQIICVIDTPPGSLLTRNRICRTRAEWAELHSQTRQVVERVQTYKPN